MVTTNHCREHVIIHLIVQCNSDSPDPEGCGRLITIGFFFTTRSWIII